MRRLPLQKRGTKSCGWREVPEDLTIIVVSLLGGTATERCLEAAHLQAEKVLVVLKDGTIMTARGNEVARCTNLGIPAKRQRAVEVACTPTVALLEDIVIPDRRWAGAVRDGLASGAVACGGPVRIDQSLPASTRALALSEYGPYGDSRVAGEAQRLPGCNFAFRRDALLKALVGRPGLVDLDAFRTLRELGGRMNWSPGMSVTLAHPFPDGARLKTRFEHGRLYASSLLTGASSAARVVRAARTILLPPLLTVRALSSAGRGFRPSAATIGWLLLQQTAWAAGELAGAIAGPPIGGFTRWR